MVHSSAPTGDAELDAALASISQASRPPRAQRWVGHPRRGIESAYLDRLSAAGVIRKERALTTRWRITDTARVAEARARVDAIASSDGPVDLAQAALGGLAHVIGLDAALYPAGATADCAGGSRTSPTAAAPRRTHATQQAAVTTTPRRRRPRCSPEAAVQAATEAAVHAAVQAAVDASVSAAHSAGAAGHGGHGGH